MQPKDIAIPFEFIEASINDLQIALTDGILTSKQLVEMYVHRIEKFDSLLNAMVVLNPKAIETATKLDKERQEKGPRGPLHGIPIIVKDNYDTYDMQTAAGSASLANSLPPDDAYQVKKLREAGAIIIGKSNMAEFAFGPYETVSSIKGTTVNPYDLKRVPAGSSGGTASAIAANFAAVGLGTDTGNSIRGPASHTSLVGIRSTMGLTSRDGIVPINLGRDIGGPMARNVADAALILDIIAGYDPKDPVTAKSVGNKPESYLNSLDKHGLKGARIAVVSQFYNEGIHPEVERLFNQAINDLKNQGAIIIDTFEIPDLEELNKNVWGPSSLKFDINAYLDTLGPAAKMKTLDDIIASEKFHPRLKDRLYDSQGVELSPHENLDYLKAEHNRELYRLGVLQAMADYEVEALIYPTWNYPPRLVGDLESPHGNNSPLMSPPTGFPALTVPMGYSYGNLPAGLQILGRAFSEPTLIKFAYAYEQATKHRKPPNLN